MENCTICINEKESFAIHIKEWLPGSRQIYDVLTQNLSWNRQMIRRANYCGASTMCQLLVGNRGIQSTISNQNTYFIDWNLPGSPIVGVRQLSEVLSQEEIVKNVCKNFRPSHCIMNYYVSGDDHTCYKNIKTMTQCIVALGCDRKFSMKHKTMDRNVEILLKSGDLLIIVGCNEWKSAMCKMGKTKEGHISLCYA